MATPENPDHVRRFFEMLSPKFLESISLPPDVQARLAGRMAQVVAEFNKPVDMPILDLAAKVQERTDISSKLSQWNIPEDLWAQPLIKDEKYLNEIMAAAQEAMESSQTEINANIANLIDFERFIPKVDFAPFVKEWAQSTAEQDAETHPDIDQIVSRIESEDPVDLAAFNNEAEQLAREFLQLMQARASLITSLNNAIVWATTASAEAPCKFLAVERNRTLVVALAAGPFIALATALGIAAVQVTGAISLWIVDWAVDRFRQENCPDHLLN